MSRVLIVCCLASLLLCSVGCRSCPSPYDYCIPAHINRPDDFRGCGPLYRAGSILSGAGYGMRPTIHGDVLYVGNDGEFYDNAGNYGTTMPVVQPTEPRLPDLSEPQQRQNQSPIGIPQGSDPIPGPVRDSHGTTIPTTKQLLEEPRRGTTPMLQVPVIPPARPSVPPAFDTTPGDEAIPFSPNDEPMLPSIPTGPFPTTTDTDPPITLEELRRLDPSVRDVQIISIEDAATTGTTIY